MSKWLTNPARVCARPAIGLKGNNLNIVKTVASKNGPSKDRNLALTVLFLPNSCTRAVAPGHVSFGRVFLINTRAQRRLLHTWIILVIAKYYLRRIGRIDGPSKCFINTRRNSIRPAGGPPGGGRGPGWSGDTTPRVTPVSGYNTVWQSDCTRGCIPRASPLLRARPTGKEFGYWFTADAFRGHK